MSFPDMLHSHGLWMYPGVAARKAAAHAGIPLIISPHGMLDSWALKNSAWKKRIAGWLYENRNLRSAACIHALCESEYQSIRAYGLTNPVCIIPNGVDLPDLPAGQIVPPWESQIGAEKNVMLFLGRIHPKKGLENLIRAWGVLKSRKHKELEQWHLVIAGWSQGGHENDLKRLTNELNLEADVTFTGPLYDTAKDTALRAAKAFILPSFSEGLPMAVLEAWSYGLPVIMTAECNIPDGFSARAAVEVRPDVESITEGLKSFLGLTEGARERMGQSGLELVKSRYSWPKIAAQMVDVYKWVLGQGDKPDCVRLN
jgi:poly(glycerol-phosphate) alpha-glucosyltransferase